MHWGCSLTPTFHLYTSNNETYYSPTTWLGQETIPKQWENLVFNQFCVCLHVFSLPVSQFEAIMSLLPPPVELLPVVGNLATLASDTTRGNSGSEIRSIPNRFQKNSKLGKSPPEAVEIRHGARKEIRIVVGSTWILLLLTSRRVESNKLEQRFFYWHLSYIRAVAEKRKWLLLNIK